MQTWWRLSNSKFFIRISAIFWSIADKVDKPSIDINLYIHVFSKTKSTDRLSEIKIYTQTRQHTHLEMHIHTHVQSFIWFIRPKETRSLESTIEQFTLLKKLYAHQISISLWCLLVIDDWNKASHLLIDLTPTLCLRFVYAFTYVNVEHKMRQSIVQCSGTNVRIIVFLCVHTNRYLPMNDNI